MKVTAFVLIVIFLHSCESSPYINHSMRVKKIGDCSLKKAPVKINANLNGERYEFEYCLPQGFDGKKYSVTREGDTLVLALPTPSSSEKNLLYQLTLNVDAYPKYSHIKLGDHVMEINLSAN